MNDQPDALARLLDGPLAGELVEVGLPLDEYLRPDVPDRVLVELVGEHLPVYRLHRIMRVGDGPVIGEYVEADPRSVPDQPLDARPLRAELRIGPAPGAVVVHSDGLVERPHEFPDKARPRDLGDPALDPPMTVRVRGGQDRAVRYSPSARRAVRATSTSPWHWVQVSGPHVGHWLTDDEVRDWPVVPAVVNEAAYARRTRAEHGEQAHERGDMDVEAFRG